MAHYMSSKPPTLDQRRKSLAIWAIAGDDVRFETLLSWQKELYFRVELALREYGTFVAPKAVKEGGE